MIVSSTDRAALWSALLALPMTWNAVPEEGVTVSEGAYLRHSNAPDGEVDHLVVTLHESENLEELTYGIGDYTEEELADPDVVIERRWAEAHELARDMVAEAARFLGDPAQVAPNAAGADWLLTDRTISVGVTQADKECPIEVCVWLLPAGLTAKSLGL